MNCGPLSEIILLGSPNHLKTSLINRFAVCSAVAVLLQGMRITPFESPWLTMTKIESKPSDNGRSMIKSIVICWKGQCAWDLMGIRGATVGCVFGFIC